jgi:hypothetical protein
VKYKLSNFVVETPFSKTLLDWMSRTQDMKEFALGYLYRYMEDRVYEKLKTAKEMKYDIEFVRENLGVIRGFSFYGELLLLGFDLPQVRDNCCVIWKDQGYVWAEGMIVLIHPSECKIFSRTPYHVHRKDLLWTDDELLNKYKERLLHDL